MKPYNSIEITLFPIFFFRFSIDKIILENGYFGFLN